MAAAEEYRGGCRRGMPVANGTPGCGVKCGHRQLVQEYRDAWDAWVALREASPDRGGGMQQEDVDFRKDHPPPLFRDWLIGRKHQGQ